MPRRARCYFPNHAYHIVQRGNNREARFIQCEDYQFYLDLWQQCCRRYGVAVHYCQPVVDEYFKHQIETKYGVTLDQMKRGRPVKEESWLKNYPNY